MPIMDFVNNQCNVILTCASVEQVIGKCYIVSHCKLNIGDNLNRKEAIALLKELIANDLVELSWVSICEKNPSDFQLQIRSNYERQRIEAFTQKHNFVIEENKDRGLLIISKP